MYSCWLRTFPHLISWLVVTTSAYIIRIEGHIDSTQKSCCRVEEDDVMCWLVLNHNQSNNIHIFIHPTIQQQPKWIFSTTNHKSSSPFYLISLYYISSIYISCTQSISVRRFHSDHKIAKVTASSFILGGWFLVLAYDLFYSF